MMRSARNFLCMLFVAILIFSATALAQSAPGRTKLPQPEDRDLPQSIALHPGDEIAVSFFDMPELNWHGQIAGDGTAKLPLAGDLHLADLTASQAAHLIDESYKNGNFVLHPQSSVSITGFALNGVSVTGEVAKPGVYPVTGQRTLLDIIAMAGGLTAAADTRVTVQHIDGTRESRVYLPADNAAIQLKDDVRVSPGDKILVPRAGTVYVLGEVTHPGGYLMPYNGRISVLQAIAQADGTLRTSATGNVFLIRRTDDSYTTQHISLHDLYEGKSADFPLVTGDVLYVPFSTAKNFVFNAPQILGALGGAAIYSVRP